MPVQDIHHVALKVKDLDRSLAFYTEVLGMKPIARPAFDFPGAWLKMGSTVFDLGGGAFARDKDGSHATGSGAIDHVSLMANDFAEMRARLDRHGVDYRQQGNDTYWFLFLRDPNGILIEMLFPRDQEPLGAKGPDGTRRYVRHEF